MRIIIVYVYNEAGNKLGERTCLSSFKSTPEISQGSGSGSTASN